MTSAELYALISKGETSKVQFKSNIRNERSIAQEMVAFANSKGGVILIGVDDKTWQITGLEKSDLQRLADLVVNAANEHVKGPIFIEAETVDIESTKVMVVTVPEGTNKPYKDKDGLIFLKNCANKRKVTSNEELTRLLQSARNFLADEVPVTGTSLKDVNDLSFQKYFIKEFGRPFQEMGLDYTKALTVKRVIKDDSLTLAGLLFFGYNPQSFRPAFTIKVVSYFGNSIAGNNYRNKPSDLKGTIPELFDQAMLFLKGSLSYLQTGESFNTKGEPEISAIALEELVQNALLHRDYFKNAPIRIFVFDNRVEIISPGKLPNSLTVNDIKFGNPVIRNNLMVAFGIHLLPYSGLGSGIKRAISLQPDLELYNDVEGEQFIVKIPRKENKSTFKQL